MTKAAFGVDFGLSVTDAVRVSSEGRVKHAFIRRPGPATPDLLERALEALGDDARGTLFGGTLGITGGRFRELPGSFSGVDVHKVPEPEAVGRGGLHLAGVEQAMVVSCGTGTSMTFANATAGTFSHVSGTAVGGGTLEGLAIHLLGLEDASAVAALAAKGEAAGVDTTLGEILGGGVGELPPAATAVNLGRLAVVKEPEPADLAAGLVTMVAQTIALIALNTAKAHGIADVIMVGRLAGFQTVRSVIKAVFGLYGAQVPHFPGGAEYATALGAALGAAARE